VRDDPDGSLVDGVPATARRDDADDAASDQDRQLPVPARTRAPSAFGGLVFAMHAVAALDLPARLAAELPDVDLRTALHAIALELCPAQPGDPAALAFAGLGPDRDAPAPIPTAADPARSIATAADDITRLLAARLGAEPFDRHALLRRRAEIVADPGWIEVHLLLDELKTAVRRTGLDVDPGWLPFLGCVVRIVYA
jgi:hypothetical protein